MQNDKQLTDETTKKFIFTIIDSEKGVDINFESFENQEEMNAVDASLIMMALTRMMVDSGLPPMEINSFLKNIGEATKEMLEGDKNGSDT